MTPPLLVAELGRMRYAPALALQRALVDRRIAGELDSDLLLLVEHDPVITLGRGTRASSLPEPPEALRARGLEVFEAERGGDVTCHGPGQLVGYPILDLQAIRPDVHWYLRALEESLIGALGSLGLEACRQAGRTGVWTGARKIASIGVHVRRWVTFHGFALNVTRVPDGFAYIIPCGLPGVSMTSVAHELGATAAVGTGETGSELWAATRRAVVDALGRTLGRDPRPAPAVLLDSAEELRRASRR